MFEVWFFCALIYWLMRFVWDCGTLCIWACAVAAWACAALIIASCIAFCCSGESVCAVWLFSSSLPSSRTDFVGFPKIACAPFVVSFARKGETIASGIAILNGTPARFLKKFPDFLSKFKFHLLAERLASFVSLPMLINPPIFLNSFVIGFLTSALSIFFKSFARALYVDLSDNNPALTSLLNCFKASL